MSDENDQGSGDVPWYQDLNAPPATPGGDRPTLGDTPTTPFAAPSGMPLGGQPPTPDQPPVYPQQQPPLPNQPPVTPQQQPPPHVAAGDGGGTGKSRTRLLVGAAVVVALLAVASGGFIAVRLFSGGGAESPEAAVETVVAAINEQDVVLAASVINPDELPMITDLAARISDARERLGVGSSGTVEGTNVSLKNVGIDADELTDDVTRLTIDSADLTGSLDSNPESTSAVVRDIVTAFDPDYYDDERSEDAREARGELSDFSLIAVRNGGGWYLSPAMSALDTALLYSAEAGQYEGDFDEAIEPGFFDSGSASPEEAVEDMADALVDGDPEKVAELLPSDVAASVAVYGDWLFEHVIPNGYNDNGVDVDDLDVVVEGGPGGTQKVWIRKLDLSDDYGEVVSIDGWRIDDRDEDYGFAGLTSKRGQDVPYFRLIREALGDSLYVLTREVDGGWKVDPVATALAISSEVIEKVDADVLDGLTASTSGEPDATIAVGDNAKVELDEFGHANLEVTTEADKTYALVMVSDDTEQYRFAWGAVRVGNSLFTRERIYDGGGSYEPYLFTASGSTRIGLGFFADSVGEVEVSVTEVPVATHQFGDALNGTLSAPVEIHVVEGIAEENVDISCNDSSVMVHDAWSDEFDVSTGDDCDSIYPETEGDTLEPLAGVGRLVLVLNGNSGAEYDLTVEAERVGFDNGELETSVTVDGSTYVSFTKPEGYWHISVETHGNADIDAFLEFGGDAAGESSTTELFFTMDLPYEAGEGELELWPYGPTDGNTPMILRMVEE